MNEPSRLVVLDGYALNPGDLDWTPLAALGRLTVHDRTPPPLVAERSAGAHVFLTNKTSLPRAVITALPELRGIAVLATGYNVVDVAAATERHVPVMNVPAYGTAAVAQHAMALLLELTQQSGLHSRAVEAGEWTRNADWSFWHTPLVELSGLTMGVIGFGAIGRTVARIARAFGMNVIAATRTPQPSQDGVTFVSLDQVFREADVVSLHCPLTPETAGMVNASRIAMMKPAAFLINTARGPLIVEADLAAALHAGRLGGVALDVLSTEPPPADHPLLHAPRCLITPHLAWAARAARRRLLEESIENVRAFLSGQQRNVVNRLGGP